MNPTEARKLIAEARHDCHDGIGALRPDSRTAKEFVHSRECLLASALEEALADVERLTESVTSAREQLPGFGTRAKAILDRAARGLR